MWDSFQSLNNEVDLSMLYNRRDGPGFNHFPRGLHCHSSVGTGISGRSGEEIYRCVSYEHMRK